MHAPANEPAFQAAADKTVDELNHIVAQAETLLRTLSAEGGQAAEAVRDRVNETLQQARARLAATAVEAEAVVETFADRTDSYVRRNPWQSVAIAALLGGVVTYLFTKANRRE
ncbi:MAG TPA: DUF883 family protein [Steroidobacteraceae bacterium]|nr:DUF883 family protein [Steroidobacteraceae bacterium]